MVAEVGMLRLRVMNDDHSSHPYLTGAMKCNTEQDSEEVGVCHNYRVEAVHCNCCCMDHGKVGEFHDNTEDMSAAAGVVG